MIMKYVEYIILICTTISAMGAVDGEMDFLPDSVKPIRYNLTLEPTININRNFYFNGSVAIDIEVTENTDCIKMHSKKLEIATEYIQVMDSNQSTIKVVNCSFDEAREFFIINLEVKLTQNSKYKLIIPTFSGDLYAGTAGFHLGKYYKAITDEKRYFVISEFDHTNARRAFPCFDAPNMKATFIINIIRTGDYFSLFNEQLEHTEDLGNNRFRDTFKETPIMPTYVVAFLVGDFAHTPQVERHRIFAKAEAIDEGKLDYALAEGKNALNLMEEFTGVKYAFSTMDQVAVPNSFFVKRPKHNWGLVTYSERILFISNETSNTNDYQLCTTFIAHEFSHQWFGNLVTPKEWKYIWLSEGFATFFQYYLASLAKPSWRLMDQFVLSVVHRILLRDTTDTNPMNYPVADSRKIPSVMNYLKASAVIRMHQHILTPPIFQRGLHIYLERHKFKAVTPSDLYQAYQDAIEENNAYELVGNYNISTILKSWDSNPGYPLITVTRNYETGAVTISQARYVECMKSHVPGTWHVPINYAYQSDRNYNFSDTSATLWLTNKTVTLQHNIVDGWLLLNKQQTGYYRVNYDNTNWERLALYLNTEDFEKIHPLNRAQLLNEAFHFADYNFITYNIPLNISKYLSREQDYIPIAAFTSYLDSLDFLMKFSPMYDVYQTFVRNSLVAGYNSIGFEEGEQDSHIDKMHRKNILPWLCKYGHSDPISKSLALIKNWRKTGILSLPPNLKEDILCCAMKHAPLEDWEFVYNISQTYTDKEKEIYYPILQCSENEAVLRRIFEVHIVPLINDSDLDTTIPRFSYFKFVDSQAGGLKIAMDYISTSNLNFTNYCLLNLIVAHLQSMDQFNQMNLRGRINPELFKVIKDNIERPKENKYIEIENWLTEYNKIK